MTSNHRKETDMKQLLTGGRVLHANHTFEENCPVLIEDEKILAVGANCNSYTADRIEDVAGMTVIPGLVDVHTHGRIGYDFNDATEEQIQLTEIAERNEIELAAEAALIARGYPDALCIFQAGNMTVLLTKPLSEADAAWIFQLIREVTNLEMENIRVCTC